LISTTCILQHNILNEQWNYQILFIVSGYINFFLFLKVYLLLHTK